MVLIEYRGMEAPGTPRYVQVPIPEDLVEDVYAFVTERRRQGASDGGPDDAGQPDENSQSAAEWDEQSLRAFLDQANPKLRKLLVYLSEPERRGRHVPAREAVAAADLTPGRSAGGFLSRAKASSLSRFGRELPLHGEWNAAESRNDYWVNEDDAAVIFDHEDRKQQG